MGVWNASCVPIFNFRYIYDYVMFSKKSFVDRCYRLHLSVNIMRFMNEFFSCVSCLFFSVSLEYEASLQLINDYSMFNSFTDPRDYQYNYKMAPAIWKEKWRKGSQVLETFSVAHVLTIVCLH